MLSSSGAGGLATIQNVRPFVAVSAAGEGRLQRVTSTRLQTHHNQPPCPISVWLGVTGRHGFDARDLLYRAEPYSPKNAAPDERAEAPIELLGGYDFPGGMCSRDSTRLLPTR